MKSSLPRVFVLSTRAAYPGHDLDYQFDFSYLPPSTGFTAVNPVVFISALPSSEVTAVTALLNDRKTQVFNLSIGAACPLETGRTGRLVSGGQ
jgi:hypothetical protein